MTECACAGRPGVRCEAHPFNVLERSEQALPCGCRLVVDVERNTTDWHPCPPCERTVGLVAGLATMRQRTAEALAASFVTEAPQSP